MAKKISDRLSKFINSLPIKDGIRILEIGCGSGAAAREILKRINDGKILAIDRSLKAIEQAIQLSEKEINAGNIKYIHSSIESFKLPDGEKLFDFAFAIHVGALDGRHPNLEENSLSSIKKCLKKNGRLYIDNGNEMIEKPLH